LIDRRKLVGLGLGAGASLLAPGFASARAHHRHPRHVPRHARLQAAPEPAPAPYAELHDVPIRLQQIRFEPRSIALKNLHTDESLEAMYWDGGEYVPDALEAVNRVLRDFRTGEVFPISPGLLDQLVDLKAQLGSTSPFQVISGYRSPQTNAMLREKSAEVAQHSLHMDGKAIDLYLEDVDLDRLHMAALDMSRGGVGYYPVTKFVHLDVGPVRHWQGA
jgi:uncharacterized protein YcbK (DUF882 family)